ncbi:MAG: DUF1836 domain-containing protein [Lachnospiraceae bacterium]|nr:DUF1836 domain-containing protein [Lachnospiraceae bacterium]
MKIDTTDLLNSIMASFDRIDYIRSEEIPNIDLYMDQVLTFMDRKLKTAARNPENDKILTKTMINNYAKNDLLPPPVKKKYSKEHVLLLIFIYYYKNILSITDIQTLLGPITERYFGTKGGLDLVAVYDEVFHMQDDQIERLKADVMGKYEAAERAFADAPAEQADFLHKFAFICCLSFDVYMKKMLIEKVIDSFREEQEEGNGKTKDRDKKKENA